MSRKIFSSALSRAVDGPEAAKELSAKIKKDLGLYSCDLAVVFVADTGAAGDSKEVIGEIKARLSPKCLIACNAAGVISSDHEVEMETAVSMLAMHLPEVRFIPFHYDPVQIDRLSSGNDLVKDMDLYPTDNPNFICLADPMSCDVTKLLELFNAGYPQAPVVGGLASANAAEADNWLFLNDEFFSEGLAGLALVGDITFETVVSQGCRPIGEPGIITKSEKNVLFELAGKQAMHFLKDIVMKLSPQDQVLARTSLFVGIARDEQHHQLGRGDFLIRNIMGVDQKSGALAIGDMVQTGQTIQFQLRDARTSAEDLEYMLKKIKKGKKGKRDEGAILVSCCGRGVHMFGRPDHDISMIQNLRGPFPLTGFFANGEFGPVDRKNYVHGYTSSLTIIH